MDSISGANALVLGVGTDEEFGRRLKAARAYRGVTQEQIAAALHCSLPSVQRMEAGTKALKLRDALAIATFLRVPLTWFTGNELAIESAAGLSSEMGR